MRPNLIIAAIGDGNVHESWFDAPGEREFDFFAIDFRPGERTAPPHADYFLQRTGFKFQHLAFLAEYEAALLMSYQYIWCADDDIALDTRNVNRIFHLMREHELQLVQPAIARGEVSFMSFRPVPGALLRFSPFVEVMCPAFTREAFFRVSHTFLESRSAWGLDLVWPQYFRREEVAILDCVHAHHTRPMATGELYRRLGQLGIDPHFERDDVVRRFGGLSSASRSYRRMLFGKEKMPTIYDPSVRRSPWRRFLDRRRAA
jgi:hypothetical protein